MTNLAVYFGLFASALAAATILPMQSESVLVGLLLTAEYPAATLVLMASLGNIIGSAVNWGLGRGIEHYKHKKWFPAEPKALQRAQIWYHRYGKWSLLLSWMPIIGDPLTIIAGLMREPFPVFLLLVSVAKTGRYAALAAITLWAVP